MYSTEQPYHEDLLHWIWENRHFAYRDIHTISGKKIVIHQSGKRNTSDGPDFSGAELSIGSLRWFGDVEIHWKLSDWITHNHHTDVHYNNVVLHVVFEETQQTIQRADGTSIPTLCLSPFLQNPLQSFMSQYRNRPQLPCAGNLSFISREAFSKQLEKAHKEYFEQKVDDLLEFYDPALSPSKAWLKMFTIALFDGLGIPHNRASMRTLATRLFPKASSVTSAGELSSEAIALSGIRSDKNTADDPPWKHKGCRPGNHPLPRIQQASDCLWFIQDRPFEQWMHKQPKLLWNEMINSITANPSLGRERSAILFGTVFLPALYSLGNLFFDEHLKNKSWTLWRTHEVPLPKSLLKMLEDTRLPASSYARKLGTIYQLRTYCRPKKCQSCKVFKSAIYS